MDVSHEVDGKFGKLTVKTPVLTGSEEQGEKFLLAINALLESGVRELLVYLDTDRITSPGLGLLVKIVFIAQKSAAKIAIYSDRQWLRDIKNIMGSGPEIFFEKETKARDHLATSPVWPPVEDGQR